MGINTIPLGGEESRHPPGRTNIINMHPPEATTYKPTYAKTSRRISTSEIRLDRPYPVPSEAGHRDLALSLIPSGRELKEEGYPVVDYESDLQTAMSTTVR